VDQENYAKKKELELFAEQLAGSRAPLEESLVEALKPQGFLSSVFASEGLAKASGARAVEGFEARLGGTRTSAAARAGFARGGANEALGRGNAELSGALTAARGLMDLDLMRRAVAMPKSERAVNQLAPYGQGIEKVGALVAPLLDR